MISKVWIVILVILIVVVLTIFVFTLLRRFEICPSLDDYLSNTSRCVNVGGDKGPFSTYNDPTSKKSVQGCTGNKGLGGENALCPGTSSTVGCVKTPAAISKLKKYYGNTNSRAVDTTSQYYLDISNVISQAEVQLNNVIQNGCIRRYLNMGILPAVMFDLDDTIWTSYDQDAQAASENKMPTINPVVEFLRSLKFQGIVPIFVTGRSATTTQVATTQLQLNNIPLFPNWDFWVPPQDVGNGKEVQSKSGVFMHNETHKKSYSSVYKANTRCWIENNSGPGTVIGGNQIKFIMSIGDQWSDSNGDCAGIRVKLPNPLYYVP